MSNSRETIKESRVTIGCICLLLLSFVAYLYFLNMSVVHVVMRKEAAHDISELRTEIAVLETVFIESQHTIASRMATLSGYNVDSEKIFVMRGDRSLVLRDN
jgi:hypothetical protein